MCIRDSYTTGRHPEAMQPPDEEWWPENYDKPPNDPATSHEGPYRDVPDEKKVFLKNGPFYGRVDLTANLGNAKDNFKGWRAHEWHHICVSWDDQNDNRLLQLFIDGEPVGSSKSLGRRGLPLLVNERMPRDNLQIGGFYRWRYADTKGLFKWGGTWAQASANGTISDFRTFRSALNTFNQPSKYEQSMGYYVNRISLPFPVGVKRLKLASVSWTAYPSDGEPGVFTAPDGEMKALAGGGVTVEVPVDNQIMENGQSFNSTNEVWIDVSKPYVDYAVNLSAYMPKGSAATMVSPVFDDITISFYLPKEEVLLTEKMHE